MSWCRNYSVCFVAAIFLIGLIACQTDTGQNPQSNQVDFDSEEFTIVDPNQEIQAVQDSTMGDTTSSDSTGDDDDRGHHLGQILKDLDLTPEQIEQIREFIADFRECVHEPLQALRDSVLQAVQDFRDQRQEIIDALNAGEIERAEAIARLVELAKGVREQIHGGVQGIKDAICDCTAQLLDNIRSILDEEQKAEFDDLIGEIAGACDDDGENNDDGGSG